MTNFAFRRTDSLTTLVVASLLVLALAPSAAAEEPGMTPAFQRQFREQIQFRVVRGQLLVNCERRNDRWETRSIKTDDEERLTVSTENDDASIEYYRKTVDGEFRFQCRNGSELTISRQGGSTPLEFRQARDGGVELAVSLGGDPLRHRAPTLWHLFLADPAVCRRHLVPLLAPLRNQWDLEEQSARLEAQLVALASAGRGGARAAWSELLRDLSADQFSQRNMAERRLVAAGPQVLPYLQGLDPKSLDAEQRQRVRRVMASLAGESFDDSPELAAQRLSGDARAWLALAGRDDLQTRILAAERLSSLLDRPVAFDPQADEAIRMRQVARLRTEVESQPTPKS